MKRHSLIVSLLALFLCGIVGYAQAQSLTGTKTIGSGGDYTTFTAAINALNTNGVGAGGVIFNVSAGATFAERPPAITATGTEADHIIFQKSGTGNNPVITPTGTSASNEAGIIISGGDYITFDGIDINASAVTNIEHGYLIRNASATNGAQNNTIKNFTVTLNRGNGTSAYTSGIFQSTNATYGGGTDPSAQSGANSYNRYLNFTVQNSASGIVMLGGSFLDQYCEISTTANNLRNTLTTLGTTSSMFSYGIYIYKGTGFTVSNCDISNLSGWGDSIVGINLIEYGDPESSLYNNSIRDLNNTNTSTTSTTKGLNLNHVYAGTGTVKFYNNTISDLSCVSSGPTTTTKVFGAWLCAYESNEIVRFYHNTISIGYGRTWDFRSTGVQNNGRSPDIYMEANTIANYTTNTGSSARSYCITAAKKYLSDGWTDYNLYYCKNGPVGSAEGWDAGDLGAWQSLVQFGKEAHSVYGDPYIIDPNTNLHGTGAKAIGQPGYTPPAYITVDMDYEARGIPTALGADTYVPIDEDSAVFAPLTQVPSGDLSPVANTAQDALEVFDFRMSDSGEDGYPTKVTTVKIKRSYIYNYADFTTVLQGALLKVDGNTLSTATAVITNDDITFSIPEGDFNIADGTTVECGVLIYFKTTGIVDGKTLKFMITKDSHGFTNAFWGSRLPVSLVSDIISNDFTINVVATQLRIIHPSRELIDRLWSVRAEAVDANGTIDTNYSSIGASISLHTGTGVLGGTLLSTFNGGVCNWNLSYPKYEWIKLQVSSGSLTGISDYIEINPYIEVSSGPIPGNQMNWNTPFIYNFYYGRSVALYTNPEVNGFYNIEALSWNVASTLNTYVPLPVKIYMKPFNGTFYGMGNTTWETLISGATLVYNGSTNAMNNTGWRKINLDSVYNNQMNPQSLLVFVESNFANYAYPTTPTFVGNYLNSEDYHYSGASGSSSLPSPFNVQKQQFRPHIRFWVSSQGYYEDTVTEQGSTASVNANATNQEIIRVNVQTGGSLSQQTINSLTFNTTGTTDVSDISAARVFYTGASATFSTTTQYGATVTNLGAKGAFTVSSNLNVSSGNHYFWLVYDIGANPSVGDQFDAQCTAAVVNNIPRTPSVTNPAGSRGVAGKKLSDVWVTQLGQGTTSSGAQNLGLLKIDLYVTEGSDAQSFASLPLNSITVTGKNTNNADVQAVKLANQTNPASFLATATMAAGTSLLANLNYELQMGTNSVYVYFDLSPGAGAGNIVDAKLTANSINVAGFTHPATEQDPNGQYTIQNFNYGGGYAQEGGYYFANTLADPAPSHPTFDWIDISTGGYNSYADMSSDDGIAPNNVTGYPIGFSFPYFGNSFTNFWIGADGAIYLTKPTLPMTPGQPNANTIAPFTTDFHPSTPNYPKTILYQNVDGKLVVTYLKVQPKTGAGPASYATFQVVLFPTGKIKIQLLEFGSSFPTNNGVVYIVNANMTAFHSYAYGGMAGPVTGASPIAVAYGQNAYMLGDNATQNDLPVPVSGTATANFPITGATVQFTTATAATNLTAIRVEVNPGGTLPSGILSLANRHWTINSTATSGLGSYNLTLNLTGITNLSSETVFYLVKREHVNSAWANLGAPLVYDFPNRTATWQISNGFSDFGLGFDTQETLPVELSSFSALPTAAQNGVQLVWTTQSESSLSGYYIYRNSSNELSSALSLNVLVEASNSSTSHTYTYYDFELEGNGTYYYWLQAVEFSGEVNFHGPVMVTLDNTNNNPPPVILETKLKSIFPNPFNPSTTLSYGIKEAGLVKLEIFNTRGQKIMETTIQHDRGGNYSYLWNADKCSSGMYFVRFSSGQTVQMQKAILLK